MQNNKQRASKRCSIDLTSRQSEKFIFVFVGLPATGKSYLSSKLAKYLNWIGFNSKVFSIGVYRRILIGTNCEWTFFTDAKTEEDREKCVTKCLEDMITFLLCGAKVGIIDGTNVRRDRRQMIEDYVKSKMPRGMKYSIMWIESICQREDIIEQNIIKNKIDSPDYKGWNDDDAANDFRKRVKLYQNVYDTLSPEKDGEDCTFIKLFDINTEIQIRNVKGFLQSKVLSFLVNLIYNDHPIYFTRQGGSEYNKKGMIGGDPALDETGEKYARTLHKYFSTNEEFKNYIKEDCIIYCSTLKRSVDTAKCLVELGKMRKYKCLDDLNVGLCESMTYDEILEKFPQDYEDRKKDKLHYRYPRGESYSDLITRVEPLIYELERRQGPVIVIGHQTTLRCLYGYFTHTPLELIPYIDIPSHTVIRRIPQAYGFREDRVVFDLEKETFSNFHYERDVNYEDNVYNIPDTK